MRDLTDNSQYLSSGIRGMFDDLLDPQCILFGEPLDPKISISHPFALFGGEMTIRQKVFRVNPLFLTRESTQSLYINEEKEENPFAEDDKLQRYQPSFQENRMRITKEEDEVEESPASRYEENVYNEMLNQDFFGVNVENEVNAQDITLINQNSADSAESNKDNRPNWDSGDFQQPKEGQQMEDQFDIQGLEELQDLDLDDLEIEG